MKGTGLSLALFGVLAAPACRAAPPAPEPAEDPWGSRRVGPEEVLGPRMATFSCEEDPDRPARTLALWLDLLGDRVVRERGEGTARLRDPDVRDFVEYRPEFDFVVRWRRGEEGFDVQVSHPCGLREDRSRGALASLAFAMWAKGVACEPAEPSGCRPPAERPPGSANLGEAIEAEFVHRGLVRLHEDVEQDANVSFYGPPGGSPLWRVDCDDFNLPRVEVVHLAEPFDARGERDLLARILRRMGVVLLWELYSRGGMPSGEEPDGEGDP